MYPAPPSSPDLSAVDSPTTCWDISNRAVNAAVQQLAIILSIGKNHLPEELLPPANSLIHAVHRFKVLVPDTTQTDGLGMTDVYQFY